MKYTKFASHLGKFFKVYMQSDRNLSPRTVQSYSQTFSLFLKFMYKTRGIESHKMELNDFTRKTVEDFLRSLESMANPPLDECHKVENWSNLKLI